jgi:hypothetical protein
MNQSYKPRFRTLWDAQKFLSAQQYLGYDIDPADYGAVSPTIENPAWSKCEYEVDYLNTTYFGGWKTKSDLEIKPVEQAPEPQSACEKTSREWYDEYSDRYTVVIASGWDDIEEDEFNDFFNNVKISRAEFTRRLTNSVLL